MLTDYFFPHVGGGVEKVTYEVSKRLVRMGWDIVVVTLNTDKTRSFEVLDGIKIYRCGSISLIEAIGAQLTISPSAPFKILRICRKEKPDIIHTNNRFFFTTICSVMLKRLLRRPLIITLHLGPVVFEKGRLSSGIKLYEKTVSKWIIKSSDRIIAVSNAVKEHAISLGAPPDNVIVVPNGVDLDEFKPREKSRDNPDGVKRVVFVGRLIFNKGAQYLVEAAPMILARHPNTEFIIVGDGPMKIDLKKQAEELGVYHAFKFLGTVPSVQEILKECDVFVRPSLTEGMPLTVLEAMACSLPIIATRVAGTPEILINNETGILVDAKDPKQLAKSVLRVIYDNELSRSLGREARRFVEGHHNWDETAKNTLRIYTEVLK